MDSREGLAKRLYGIYHDAQRVACEAADRTYFVTPWDVYLAEHPYWAAGFMSLADEFAKASSRCK